MPVISDKSLKYKQLATKMEQDILSGALTPGQPVPSIRTLMASDSLSKGTVLKSLRLLEKRGLVTRHPQRGFFVTDRNRPDPKMLQIAFITPSLSGDTLPCVKGINQTVCAHDHITLATYSTQADLPRYKQLVEKIAQLRPAGVILTAIERDLLAIDLRPLAESGIPTVILGDAMEGIQCDRVSQSGEGLARQAVLHLLSRGGRRMALMLGQSLRHPSRDGVITAVRQELTAAGLNFDDDCALSFDTPHGYMVPADPYIDAREKMYQVLAGGTPFDSIITLCDYYAVGALQAIQKVGRRIPRDIRVASITRNAVEGVAPLRLTTVDTRPEERARVATELLLRRIEGYQGLPEVHHVGGELIVGDTT